MSDIHDSSFNEHSSHRRTASGLKVKNVKKKSGQNNFMDTNSQYVRAIVNNSIQGR